MTASRYFVATRLGGDLRPVDHWLYANAAEAEERAAFDPEHRVVLDVETGEGAEVFRRRARVLTKATARDARARVRIW